MVASSLLEEESPGTIYGCFVTQSPGDRKESATETRHQYHGTVKVKL